MGIRGLNFAVPALAAFACLALAIALGRPAESGAAEEQAPPRVYVVVVDGMRPEEVDALTPTLTELKGQGTWYQQARAVFPGETLPNHAAMATGMLPRRSGIIGNQMWSAETGFAKQYLEHPGLLDADTIVTRLERACGAAGADIATSTVMGKTYLYGLFRGEPPGPPAIPNDPPPDEPQADDPNPQREADFHWLAPTFVPVSNHAPDAQSMQAFREWITTVPAHLPQFGFLNLAEVDRAGHADQAAGMSFGAVRPLRQGGVENADAQVRLLVEDLKSSGAWDETALIVLSDHGMDYGPQNNEVSLASTLTGGGYTTTPDASVADANVVGGGGSGLVWVADKANIPHMAKLLAAHEGVEFVSTRAGGLSSADVPLQTTHDQMGFDHPRSPDIEVFVKKGWHVSDGQNVIPGNHAHPVTQHSVLLVTGGHPAVQQGVSVAGPEDVYDESRTTLFAPPDGPGPVSVAPTVAALLGIGEPPGGYDGEVLSEALDASQLPPGPVCGRPAADQPAGGTDDDAQGGEAAPPPPPRLGADPAPPRSSGLVSTSLLASRQRARSGDRVTLSGRIQADPGCSGPYRVLVRRNPTVDHRQGHHVTTGAAATSVRAGPDGRWRLTVRARRTAQYGAAVHPTRTCTPGTQMTVVVEVTARIQVFVPRPCRPGRVVSGRVLPSQPRTRVLLQRRRAGRWVTVARRRTDHHSGFGFRLRSCAGRYRVVWPKQGVVSLRGVRRLSLR